MFKVIEHVLQVYKATQLACKNGTSVTQTLLHRRLGFLVGSVGTKLMIREYLYYDELEASFASLPDAVFSSLFTLEFYTVTDQNYMMRILGAISNVFYDAGLMVWDVSLTLGNLVSFSRPVGKVTPQGHPGYGGHWPEYMPAKEGDSRCACPALNAMANHGIIARSGRGIKITELNHKVHSTYNFSASCSSFTAHQAARTLNKDYNKDTLDLEELNLHNGIEHDASLTRLDAAFQPNQAIKHDPFIQELLSFATGKDADGKSRLTKKDMSRISGKRRAEARATNKEYTTSLVHRYFGSSNSATLLTIFGGRVDDLHAFLLEERLPEGWESRIRKPLGLTIMTFNLTILPVEFGIREWDWAAEARKAASEDAIAT